MGKEGLGLDGRVPQLLGGEGGHSQVQQLHPLERDRASEVQTTRDTLAGGSATV